MSGDYFFENVLPGNYILVEEQPADYVSVLDFDRSTDDENDPDGGDDGSLPNNEISVTLASGEDDFGNDFVESRPGRISGSVTELTPDGETGITGVIDIFG